jgi:DNA replication and repair protein RecF
MIRRVAFESVSVRAFRNLTSVDFSPSPRLNVISGDNGQGKTSLVEALYVASTSRSFRSERVAEVIQEGQERAVVRTQVVSDAPGLPPLRHEQRAVVAPRGRSFLIDGKKPKLLSDYATKTPMVVFHPGDLTLASGPASGRRTLLDRIVLYLDPAGSDARLRYQKALRERQHLLETRGTTGADLDAYEEVLAEHGARFALARERAAEALIRALVPAWQRMAKEGLVLTAQHAPGGVTSRDDFARELRARRDKDLRRGAATFGPQRDELALEIAGRPARSHASQGQQRILTLSLKVAELDCVREACRAQPVLLLDDVSSELDPERTGAVYGFLRDTESQVFVTTTRPELFVTVELLGRERADFTLRDGVLAEAPANAS